MPRHFTATLPRHAILLTVAAALLLSQALGLLHRVVHSPPAPAAHLGAPAFQHATLAHARSHAQAQAHAEGHGRTQAHAHLREHAAVAEVAVAEPAASGHWLDLLFADHEASSNACASYDQLTHADFLWNPPAEHCIAVTASAECASNPAWHLAAQAAGYLARGPPRLA